MATIILSLSTKSDKVTSQHEVMIRFFHGKHINKRAKTNVFVHPDYWDDAAQSIVIPKWRMLNEERKRLTNELQTKSNRLDAIKSLVLSSFQALNKNDVPKDWLKSLINGFNFPKAAKSSQQKRNTIYDDFEKYIDTHKFSDHRRRQNYVILRTLKRFAMYKGLSLSFDSITADTLRDFEQFLVD